VQNIHAGETAEKGLLPFFNIGEPPLLFFAFL
jgi:hypothetical protein